jgi:hypothetical protein
MDVYQRRRLVALSAVAAVFVILVLVIRSCGGDDDGTPITPVSGATGAAGATSLTQEEFASQGDSICLQTNTLLAQTEDSDPASGEEGELIAGELEQLQTLPPPTDGEDQLQNYLAALSDQVAAYDERRTAAERGDDATVAEIDVAIDEAASAAAKAARKFGFQVCGDRDEVSESGGNGADGDTSDTATDDGTATESVTPAPTDATPVAPADSGGETAPVEPAPEPAPAPTDDGSGSGGITP